MSVSVLATRPILYDLGLIIVIVIHWWLIGVIFFKHRYTGSIVQVTRKKITWVPPNDVNWNSAFSNLRSAGTRSGSDRLNQSDIQHYASHSPPQFICTIWVNRLSLQAQKLIINSPHYINLALTAGAKPWILISFYITTVFYCTVKVFVFDWMLFSKISAQTAHLYWSK